MMALMMVLSSYGAPPNYSLSALQLLKKHELIYNLFFTHTNIHTAAIVLQSHLHLTLTDSEVAEISILNLLKKCLFVLVKGVCYFTNRKIIE